jgi:hypothetical protein
MSLSLRRPDWIGNEYVVIIGVAAAIAVVGALVILIANGNSTGRRLEAPLRVTQSNDLRFKPNETARNSPMTRMAPSAEQSPDPTSAPSIEPAAVVLTPPASEPSPADSFVERAAETQRESASFPGEKFPQTRTQALTDNDVAGWSAADIQYAINEIFARHGAEFPSKQVAANFAQFAWYHPQHGLSFDQIEASLPNIEQGNVQVLGGARNAKKNPNQATFVQQMAPRQDSSTPQPVPNTQTDYPMAQWSLFNGCVFSPYPPNNLIKVDNVAPGSLVTDPTTNGAFRTPTQPPDPQMFPIAQWSNVPGNVISPYPPNNLLNVSNVPLGTLRVDPTTNGVFRTPYNPGPSVNPAEVIGGLLQGLSQAIQNSGGVRSQGSQSNNYRRRRP